MTGRWGSLRVRLALLGFLAIYGPALLLFGVVLATDTETETRHVDGVETVQDTTSRGSIWVSVTVLALSPAAAALAWWWAGRAVRPIDRVRAVADDIRAADLSRRIALSDGPAEVAALAASFDAMLERLHEAGETQRRLIEEASHELRIPLAVLVTNAEVLLAHPKPTVEAYRRGLERSRVAAVRLQAVLDELLVDARGRARILDRRPADLMVVVRAIVDEASVPGVNLSFDGPETAICPVDEPTVRRAVHNLVDNAIRYSPPGTPVRVAVEVTAHDVAVVVTDRGPGIAASEHDRVFQRFWRGRSDVPGTGLGLAIARQVAQAHGGDLTLTSPGPSGEGSTFYFTVRRL
ncbi:HAMP domain-containing sensor histidine kinase [Micromonospora sp. CPCC 206061]|uniref:HAMP domain-containing sensor histidine kinase n=1 Tax=Micromonospora sp. CPCC 206061 TaxID=3122410 RepID=UPI002FF173D2